MGCAGALRDIWRSWRAVCLAAAALAAAALAATPAEAIQIYLSTANGATLGGLTFRDGDIVRYDTVAGTASLFFSENAFSANENVDAFSMLPNGHLLLSTAGNSTIGGLNIRPGDVAEYDPVSGVATLFFNQNLFLNAANIDAFTVLPNGHVVLSTVDSETLAGLAFRDGDLVEYNPVSGAASLFFNEDLFAANEDIDAVSVLEDGSIVLSTETGAILGGLSFRDGDLVRYFPLTNTAILYFSESAFSANENIDAVFVPEPGTGLLLAMGLAHLSRRRQRVV
jgi:hypothetical protein